MMEKEWNPTNDPNCICTEGAWPKSNCRVKGHGIRPDTPIASFGLVQSGKSEEKFTSLKVEYRDSTFAKCICKTVRMSSRELNGPGYRIIDNPKCPACHPKENI